MVLYSALERDTTDIFPLGTSISITLPLPMMKNDTLFTLNRKNNTHYQVYKKIKNEYKDIVKKQFEFTKYKSKFDNMNISYRFYLTNTRFNKKPDLDNISAMTKKFFNDAIKDIGLIDDDNIEYISSTCEKFAGISDKDKVEIDMVQVGEKTVAIWSLDKPKLTKKNTFEYDGEKFFFVKKDWNGKPHKMYHFYRYKDGMLVTAVFEIDSGIFEIETKWKAMKARWNL